jgi:hypothetical protein
MTKVSLIETLPFKDKVAAKNFKQHELEDQYDTNARFKRIIDQWMRASVELEHTAFVERRREKQPAGPVPKHPF